MYVVISCNLNQLTCYLDFLELYKIGAYCCREECIEYETINEETINETNSDKKKL